MKFKPLDTVIMINDGALYTGYEELAHKLGAIQFRIKAEPPEHSIGIIINSGYHEERPNTCIYLFRVGSSEYLIEERGLILFESCSDPFQKVIATEIIKLGGTLSDK